MERKTNEQRIHFYRMLRMCNKFWNLRSKFGSENAESNHTDD